MGESRKDISQPKTKKPKTTRGEGGKERDKDKGIPKSTGAGENKS